MKKIIIYNQLLCSVGKKASSYFKILLTSFIPIPLPPPRRTETPSFQRPLEDRTVARGETAVLQCIARGSPAPRLNWTKDDGPLLLTERHFFAAANQLLIIVDARSADAGKYTCIMSNTLGTERGHIYLSVSSSPNCELAGSGYDPDGWTTVGIVVMVVVCCVVGTSLVWVMVIYHMRRKSEDYSITNTGRWLAETLTGVAVF